MQVRPRGPDSVQLVGHCKDYTANYIIHLIAQLKEIYPGTRELKPVGVEKEDSLTWQRKDKRGRKPGMSEWRVKRAKLFEGVKKKYPKFSKANVAKRAQLDENNIIANSLRESHPKWDQKKIDDKTVEEFKKKWHKKYFTQHDVRNDYKAMDWDWWI